MKKWRIGILFGGRSSEHEVSWLSAKNVIASLNTSRYQIFPIKIDHKGTWFYKNEILSVNLKGGQPAEFFTRKIKLPLDVIFPVLHGPYGEDGTIQGLLEVTNTPYVGAGVLGSAIGMDKEAQKLLFFYHGLPTPQFETIRRREWGQNQDECLRRIEQRIGFPCFIKPVNLGSSVGISKVKKRSGLTSAVDDAFSYDTKVMAEEFIPGREVFCGVLGNEEVKVSLPGEVVPKREFYDYVAKYVSSDTGYKVPVPLEAKIQDKVMRLAKRVYQAAFCEGMARVDFFLKGEDELSVCEINTIPGFTSHSLFPKIWAASGLPFSEVLDILVDLAFDRWHKKRKLKIRPPESRFLKT